MKKYSIKLMTLLGVMMVISLISCDDDVTVVDQNGILPETFFENKEQLQSGSASLYAHLQTQGLYQRYAYILPDSFSDEMVASSDENFLPSYQFNMSSTLQQTGSYWVQNYNGIAKANFMLSEESVSTMRKNAQLSTSGYTDTDVDNALGEAHFMRGIYYYLLVKRYGGVPIQEVGDVIGQPRTSEDAIYDLIINDFTLASQLLFERGATENGRATKGAALGMLGKVHLHRENYTMAKAAFDQISGYSLLPAADYKDNFNVAGEHNDESLFEITFSADNNPADTWTGTGTGTAEITFHAQEYSGWGNLRPSQKMIDEFEVDDPRKNIAILEDGDSYGPGDVFTNSAGTIWYKFSDLYENEATVPEGTTNTRFLRYADIILMQAEAALGLGNIGSAEPGAVFYLNEIRNRFSLPLYGSPEMDSRGFPVGTNDGVFNAIVHERMVELCAEQHRFDDLVRWGLDATELTTYDDNDTTGNAGQPRPYNPSVHRFMPIPQSEIDTNPNINSADQNPGY